jgi:hypothetical protein
VPSAIIVLNSELPVVGNSSQPLLDVRLPFAVQSNGEAESHGLGGR